jgi:hypothetical protein
MKGISQNFYLWKNHLEYPGKKYLGVYEPCSENESNPLLGVAGALT